MKIIGQDADGRINIDGEGLEIQINRSIPASTPVRMHNFVFKGETIIYNHCIVLKEELDPIDSRFEILDL